MTFIHNGQRLLCAPISIDVFVCAIHHIGVHIIDQRARHYCAEHEGAAITGRTITICICQPCKEQIAHYKNEISIPITEYLNSS